MTSPQPLPPSDHERERAAEILQQACGEGRLTLEQFSARVGAVWAAETTQEIERATADLAPTPIVGSAQTVDSVLTIFSESKRRGRWRLRSPRVWLRTFFGSTELDLREVITSQSTIEIAGLCLFGQVTVIVPEGVEVDLTGPVVFSNHHLQLAPVPRVPGTPEVRVDIATWFGQVQVISKPYSLTY
ncbi:DUF1707 SHOCT-like domain-containing protein [Paractinoplanes globisporus]|uniref:DUF1707 domain-containing protein n=1 Tax=Paractinoplanes globisporus TaxID=113565 RepID=A0ABW6WYN8_9ACTN|nr:DUF1707 domain-containing protein [Actinoplanes globisporus]